MFGKLLLLFILVPLAELALFWQLSEILTLPITLGIIVITGILGAYLAKQQGGLAWRNFQQALTGGQLPHQEATDGILILLAGAVLLTPGFLTDALGFSLLITPIRTLLRGLLANWLKNRVQVSTSFSPQQANSSAPPEEMKSAKGRVIDSQ